MAFANIAAMTQAVMAGKTHTFNLYNERPAWLDNAHRDLAMVRRRCRDGQVGADCSGARGGPADEDGDGASMPQLLAGQPVVHCDAGQRLAQPRCSAPR